MTEMAGLDSATVAELAGWARVSGCRLLILFGSTASGRASMKSDIDLAVAFETLPAPERRLSIIGELQSLCGRRSVDVVFLHRDTNPVVRFEVFRSGHALYEAMPGTFVTEVVRALVEYEDALPFRSPLQKRVAGRSGPT